DNVECGATNLSYSNFIKDSPEVLTRYFTAPVRVGLVQRAVRVHKLEIAWQEHGELDLRFQLEAVIARMMDAPESGYNLTTIAGSSVATFNDAMQKLDALHDRLQVFFPTLLSDHAKNEWGYHG